MPGPWLCQEFLVLFSDVGSGLRLQGWCGPWWFWFCFVWGRGGGDGEESEAAVESKKG